MPTHVFQIQTDTWDVEEVALFISYKHTENGYITKFDLTVTRTKYELENGGYMEPNIKKHSIPGVFLIENISAYYYYLENTVHLEFNKPLSGEELKGFQPKHHGLLVKKPFHYFNK
jgi:hypothetical protein